MSLRHSRANPAPENKETEHDSRIDGRLVMPRKDMNEEQNYERQRNVALSALRQKVKTGQRVKISQPTCTGRHLKWRTKITGTVLDVRLADTGAWYAHSTTGHLQLVRIRIQKDNGEVSDISVDASTTLEHVPDAPRVT